MWLKWFEQRYLQEGFSFVLANLFVKAGKSVYKWYQKEKQAREGKMRNEKGRLRMADIIKVERDSSVHLQFCWWFRV